MKLISSACQEIITTIHEVNGYLLHQKTCNGVIVYQYFTTKDQRVSHPYSDAENKLQFRYYPNGDQFQEWEYMMYVGIVQNFLETKWQNLAAKGNKEAEAILNFQMPIIQIFDPASFTAFDKLYCKSNYDGLLYRIDSPYPLPIWKKQDYIGGYSDRNFDLSELQDRLLEVSWIRHVKKIDIPYYNSNCGNQAIQFDYKLPEDVIRKVAENHSLLALNMELTKLGPLGLDLLKLKSLYHEDPEDNENEVS